MNQKIKKILSLLFLLLISFQVVLNAQNKRALLIGISKYENACPDSSKWSDIHGCNDVMIIKNVLKEQSFNVKCLTGNRATAKGIRESLKALVKATKEGDIVYIHLSGHGQAFEDLNGDEKDGWDESFVAYDARKRYNHKYYQGQNHIVDDELHNYLLALRQKVGPKGMVYVVIDACHAGSSYRSESDDVFVRGVTDGFSKTYKKYTPSIDKRDRIKLSDDKNLATIILLEACRSYETNVEIIEKGEYYGPLSYYIAAVLKGMTINNSKWIEKVRKLIDGDVRLVRQHLVIESSK